MTGPIDPADLADLQTALANGEELDQYEDEVCALLASHAWHRARVQVTDEDIRRVGLGDPDVCTCSLQLVAWCKAGGQIEVVGDASRDLAKLPGLDCSAMAHDWIINRLAETIGRPPLDVLDEIAGVGR